MKRAAPSRVIVPLKSPEIPLKHRGSKVRRVHRSQHGPTQSRTLGRCLDWLSGQMTVKMQEAPRQTKKTSGHPANEL